MAERKLVTRLENMYPSLGLNVSRIDILQGRGITEERHYLKRGGVAFYYFDSKTKRPLSGEEVRRRSR
jgi:hypothetical protein